MIGPKLASQRRLWILAQAEQKVYVKRQSQIKLELRVIAVIFINIGSIPAGMLLSTLCHNAGFTVCREGRRKAEQRVCDFWMGIKLISVYLLILSNPVICQSASVVNSLLHHWPGFFVGNPSTADDTAAWCSEAGIYFIFCRHPLFLTFLLLKP